MRKPDAVAALARCSACQAHIRDRVYEFWREKRKNQGRPSLRRLQVALTPSLPLPAPAPATSFVPRPARPACSAVPCLLQMGLLGVCWSAGRDWNCLCCLVPATCLVGRPR